MPSNVTASNIIVGPCSSFSVGGTDLGGTSGGVQIEKKQTFFDSKVDQFPGIVNKTVTDETYTVTTSLSEATLANLQLSWGIKAAPVTDATAATNTLSLGIESATVENPLTFVGPAPGGKTRTFSLNRAINVTSNKLDIAKDKEQLFAVSFECLPDLTKAAGSEYGTVVDK